MPDQVPSTSCDVTVIGGGLAGMAASLHLAGAGLKVVCLEPRQAVRPPVGESLDWTAAFLLVSCCGSASFSKALKSRFSQLPD